MGPHAVNTHLTIRHKRRTCKRIHVDKDLRKTYKCPHCSTSLPTKPSLKRHISNHSEDRPLFRCTVEGCGKLLKAADNLKRHVQTFHTGLEDARLFECILCDYQSKTKNRLDQHVRILHLKKLKYKCNICQLGCITPSRLQRHLATHEDLETRKKYSCSHCAKTFLVAPSLKRHVEANHSKVKPYTECPICHTRLKCKSYLVKHIATVHATEKKWICSFCSFKSVHKAMLESHIARCHTKERRFSCYFCKELFYTRADVNTHMVRHTKELALSCKLCSYRDYDYYRFRRHERKHG